MATAVKAPIGGDVPTNGAQRLVAYSEPYQAQVTLLGTTALLFHRWNCEAVEEKAKAAKGSKAKKTDDVESYVYRNDDGELCLPGEYLRQAIVRAAKFRQDPRSPRKSAMDLVKAAVFAGPELATLGTKDWDYLDTRRVVIQGNAINRVRPALLAGWTCEMEISVVLPEYVSEAFLLDLVSTAGKLIGVGDFRPTYGRFAIQHWEVES